MIRQLVDGKSVFNTKSMRGLLMTSAASLSFVGMATPANAQDIVEEDDGEVVITVIARKNAESLQDVPVTVTAIGGEQLDRYQVDQIADVVNRIPSLTVLTGGSGAGGAITLRGVGSSAISAAFDSSVAFNFDGVQVSSARIVQAGFFDTQQIEVLKGPQSLYFGKSASAGVFSIRSADPTADWEVGGKGSYEFEEKGYTIGGYISGPITDTLGIRVAAQYNDIDELIDLEPSTPASINPRGQTNFVGRVTLQWDPADRFNANLKLNYVRNRSDGANQFTDIDCGADGVADPSTLGLFPGLVLPSATTCDTNDSLFVNADQAPPLVGRAPDQQAGRDTFAERGGTPFGQTDIFYGRLKFDLDLSDALTLSWVSGYLDSRAIDSDVFGYTGTGPAIFGLDEAFYAANLPPIFQFPSALQAANGPGIPLGIGGNIAENETRQFTQELRLSSDYDGMFNFQVGAFYESRQIEFNTSQQAVNISLAGPDPVTGNTFDWYKEHFTKTETVSFFGSATLDITDDLELSGGIRWTDEQKVNTINVPYVHSFLIPFGFLQSGFFAGPINFSDDNFSPEATIKYRITDDINIYAAYKTGFKSGGIDNSALPSGGLAAAAAANDFSGLIFDSETTKGFEIGMKGQFFDRALTLNASVYRYVFDDLQVQNFDAQAVQFETLNAGELTSQGVDVDFNWRTPLEGLSISGAFAYTDAEFTDTFITDAGVDSIPGNADDTDLDGRTAARAPDFSGNIAIDWFIPLGDSLELGLNGNLAYSDSYLTNEDTLNDDLVQDSYVTLDGSISVGHPDSKWKLSLVGVNLTDKIFTTSSGGRPFATDDQVVTQNRGRQVYVEASFKF